MRVPAVLAFVLVVLVSSLVIGGLWAEQKISEKDSMADYLLAEVEHAQTDRDRLEKENGELTRQVESLSGQVASLKADLAAANKKADETLVPQEIGGTADFPIERGMAKQGESVATFAKRQGTTIEVLKALNPWLDTKKTLRKYQTLWLPTK